MDDYDEGGKRPGVANGAKGLLREGLSENKACTGSPESRGMGTKGGDMKPVGPEKSTVTTSKGTFHTR
jgi:hypothetical protein